MNTKVINEEQVLTALISEGWLADNISLRSLPRGANNRVFLLEINGKRLIAKYYYQHPDDPRDRLSAEYSFLTYAFALGIGNVPHPVAQDKKIGLGIYSYVEGEQLTLSDVNRGSAIQAARFFHALNRNRDNDLACKLPIASEACFSLAEHCNLIEKRIHRLKHIKPDSAINRHAIRFVNCLQQCWSEIRQDLQQKAENSGISYNEDLSPSLRCISPSDFGFHNALKTSDGELIFLDFEYAGWDDPGKMGADFFCQPELPISENHMQDFLETAFQDFCERDMLIKRANLLLPAYRIKWCCIILNEFLPDSASRRFFAKGSEKKQQQKEIQLDKAERVLNNLLLPLS